MNEQRKAKPRLDWLPGAAVLLSVVACYGTLAAVAVLSMLGVGLAVNEAAWAGAISLFAVIAAILVALNSQRHGSRGPLVLAVLGTALVAWAMFFGFSRVIELSGFAALIGATAWDWRLLRRQRGSATDCR